MGVTEVDGEGLEQRDLIPLVVAEYSSLRTEIQTHLTLQEKLTSGASLGLGAFVALAVQEGSSLDVIALYPWFSLILSAGWRFHRDRTVQIAAYIAKLEEKYPAMGWAKFLLQDTRIKGFLGVRPSLVLPLLTFVGLGLLSIYVYANICDAQGKVPALSLLFAGGGAVVLTAFQVLRGRVRKVTNLPLIQAHARDKALQARKKGGDE